MTSHHPKRRHFPSPLTLARGLLAALFTVAAARADSVVTFNEIQYHPANQSNAEWIELTNLMAVNVDVSEWRIRGGVEFDFPEGTVIEAGGFLVIASEPAAVAQATGLANVLGPWSASLSNGGEPLRLRNNSGRLMDRIRFSDGDDGEGDWPIGADGSGATLAKIHPDTASPIAANWVASHEIGGTPGKRNFAPPGDPADIDSMSGGLIFNEITTLNPFRIELANLGTAAVDLAGVRIVSRDGALSLPRQLLEPGAFLVFDAEALGFSPGPDDLLFLMGEGGATLLDARPATAGLRGHSSSHPGQWLYPSEETFGSENIFAFHDDIVINEIMYHFREDPGTPPIPPEVRETALVPIDANWRYNETGADLGGNWAQAPHSVDAVNWRQGTALLGAESNPADLPEPLRTAFANPVANAIITYYAETEFELTSDQLKGAAALRLRHIVDDGAIFYLNGTEILRFNLDAGVVTAATPASDSVGNAAYSDLISLPADLLIAGTNRLSAEIHQRSATSSDVIFGAELTVEEVIGSAVPGTPIIERNEEWVELLNTGSAALDLSGWSLEGGIRYEFPDETSIAPGGYVVVGNDSLAMRAKYPDQAATIVGDFRGSLNNNRDTVRLRDAIGNLADEVTYFEGGRWAQLADGNGSSLELRDSSADNNQPEAWAASDESARMPWQTVRYRMDGDQEYGLTKWREFRIGMLRAGEVLLDDISVVRDPDGDAEELIQDGSFEADPVSDTWRMLGNHRHSEVVPDPADGGNRVLHLIATGSTDTRHNHLETSLVDNTALTSSQIYEVSYRARWIAGSNQLNTRGYYLRIARTTALDRPELSGTPGAANSRHEENIGPTYTDLRHEPSIPAANEPVIISADVSDSDGLGNIVLRARVDGEDTIGIHDFSLDENGHGQGTLPGQPEGTVVQFWIEAEDALGAMSMIPARGPESRALYQVEDGRGKDLQAHELRVIMLDGDSDFMHSRFNLMSNEQLGGAAIYNRAEIFYDVGVRLRGSGAGRARDGNDYRGFRVSFPADHLFRGVHGSVGLDRSGRSPGVKRQDEIYVKHMFNRAGIPCMYDDLVHFIPPTLAHTGTSILQLAAYGSVFTESQFENGGRGSVFNYDITCDPSSSVGGREGLKPPVPFQHIGTDLRDLGDDKEQYRAPLEIRTGRRRDDYSGLINFCQVMSLPAADLEREIDEWMDVDEWMRYTAMMALCGIGDTYILGGLQHNIRFYVPEDGRGVVALPWDMDFVFSASASASIRSPGAGNVRKVFGIPRVRRLYWGHVQDLINTTFNENYMAPWLDHYGAVVGQRFTSQTSYIRRRSASVSRQLPDEVPFAITTNGGADFEVNATTATLEGKGWINIREFRLEGSADALPVEWQDENAWRVTIPLHAGANELTLQSHDFQGALLDSRALIITSLATDPTPVEFLRITEIHYNPVGADDSEFIELRNIGAEPLDIGGVAFTDGIGFTFAEGTILGAGEFILVVRDRAAFEQAYGQSLPVAGAFVSGALSNGGESIELRNRLGVVIHGFTFDDSWVPATDGGGVSLTVVDDAMSPADWDNASHWRASSVPDGTPGAADPGGAAVSYDAWLALRFSEAERADPTITGPDVILNSDTSNLLKFAFGLDPRTPNPPGSLPAATVVDDQLRLTYRRNRAASARFTIEHSSNLITWTKVDAALVGVEPADADTDLVTVRVDGALPAYLRLRVSITR